MDEKLLVIEELCVDFPTEKGTIRPVNRVSLEIRKGAITGLVGESGCGKSMTARAVMNLIKKPGKMTSGRIWLEGRDLGQMAAKERRMLQGKEISMIFQDPMSSLNPVMKVGKQVDEVIRLHERVDAGEAKRKTLEMFEAVGIPDPERRYDAYPHQLSGGLRQRVMIAMAMICRPKLLIADEPTTALDVTVEAQILDLMEKLREGGTSILLISHNLGVIARMCDDVYVMYAGKIVEHADVEPIFENPVHPYTKGLLRAVTSLREEEQTLETIPGNVPQLDELPTGCRFSNRCAFAGERCRTEEPVLQESGGHACACFMRI
jgi:oligopeptide/dipeptide ABC transporter ATP-binding protein